jgi:hypothetical protein
MIEFDIHHTGEGPHNLLLAELSTKAAKAALDVLGDQAAAVMLSICPRLDTKALDHGRGNCSIEFVNVMLPRQTDDVVETAEGVMAALYLTRALPDIIPSWAEDTRSQIEQQYNLNERAEKAPFAQG